MGPAGLAAPPSINKGVQRSDHCRQQHFTAWCRTLFGLCFFDAFIELKIVTELLQLQLQRLNAQCLCEQIRMML